MKARADALAMSNFKKIRQYLDRSSCLKLANATIFRIWFIVIACSLIFQTLRYILFKEFRTLQLI
ncbi:hypothetical protein HOLleu_10317 [Holothuria leucospilota]|uniref:Uncharacterized protein n=1 Tax=Holothuria leucospilota TaxID=206669 RepID=A0A9Q1CCX4_HOLLE|nr:hypothetical protein HOLleu_10317 [Holothuria leucospilota]